MWARLLAPRRSVCHLSAARAVMANKTKWVAAEKSDEPIQEVARRALESRLDLVWRYLPAAAKGPRKEIENVHQLRVATRRAMAALEIFADLLPGRRKKWMQRRLKQVRKAAGDARDFDVLGQRLAKRLDGEADPSVELLLVEVQKRRKAAQRPIEASHAKLKRKDFPRREARLLKHVRLRTESDLAEQPSFAEAGVHALRQLVQDFFAAADGDLSDPVALHAFRIQGKQLRYAMEIFAGAFPPALRKKLYPQVERLQEKLGDINDHASARRHFGDWIGTTERPEVAEVLRTMGDEETTALGESTARFFAWWTTKRSDSLRLGFAQLLTLDKPEASLAISGRRDSKCDAAATNGSPPHVDSESPQVADAQAG